MEGLKSHYRRAVIVWLALVGGIFSCWLAVERFQPDVPFLQKGSSCPEMLSFKCFLLIFSALTPFLIWFVRAQILAGKAPAGKALASRLLTASIFTHALCEMTAINGVTLFLLTRNLLDFYLSLILSFALFIYFFPRYPQWEEWSRQAERIGGQGF